VSRVLRFFADILTESHAAHPPIRLLRARFLVAPDEVFDAYGLTDEERHAVHSGSAERVAKIIEQEIKHAPRPGPNW
jgi:hypothetical protein